MQVDRQTLFAMLHISIRGEVIMLQYNTIQKFITRTYSQALSMNRMRGQSLGGQTVC